jgi:DNA-binding CsgD family transcriptional regulator
MTQVALTERDARIVLAAALDLADAARSGAAPVDLLNLVGDIVACDAVSWSNMDRRLTVQLNGACTVEDEGDGSAFAAFSDQHPGHDRALPLLFSWDDMVSRPAWERTDLYNEFYRPIGVRQEIGLDLGTAPSGYTNVVLLTRFDKRDFDPGERGLLRLLRPHLAVALQPAPPPAQLTGRQRQVLSLVRRGHTNAQVARRLGVTAGTVRAHLEDIYARLDVHSRTEAVRAAAAELDG